MPARVRIQSCRVFFFNDTATTEIYTLSLHDALPIYTEIHRVIGLIGGMSWESSAEYYRLINQGVRDRLGPLRSADRKSTRLNSSHSQISYAVFCLKKKKKVIDQVLNDPGLRRLLHDP